MPSCWNCGEEIEFRYVNGRLTPIHIYGGWCSASSERTHAYRPFRDIDSYVNPNASCPVCGDRVFYFQSRHGGRVFFDALGWPWPKHPCTDGNEASTRGVTMLRPTTSPMAFRNKFGEALEIYEIGELIKESSGIRIRFRRVRDHRGFWTFLSGKFLSDNDLQVVDFKDAPSFLIKKESPPSRYPSLEFISARKKGIIQVTVQREQK